MKSAAIFGLLALATSSLARPSNLSQNRRRMEQNALQKRDTVVTVTVTDYVTADTPSVTVYVNSGGTTVSIVDSTTTIVELAAATSTSKKASKSTSTSTSASSTATAATQGLVYSPYNVDACKTADDIAEDLAGLPSGYNTIRLYGVDCSQVELVGAWAKTNGWTLTVGISNISETATQLASISSQLDDDFSFVDTIIVGNEVVNTAVNDASSADASEVGTAAVAEVVAALATARDIIGSDGPNIVTADTFNMAIEYPELCTASDATYVNMHPYYDDDVDGSTAEVEAFMSANIALVQAACGRSKVVISETGWPWKSTLGTYARISKAVQKTAIAGIKAVVADYIILSSYNDPWKAAGSDGTEQYWGLNGANCPSS